MRAGDIVLGRILGFTIVGTVLLAIMGAVQLRVRRGGCWTTRTKSTSPRWKNVVDADGKVVGKKGRTTLDQYHRHEVELDADGNGRPCRPTSTSTTITQHAARRREPKYVVSGPDGYAAGPRAAYGKLRFLDRKGVDGAARHQRRQRMDVSQLHRRRHAGGGDLDVRAASTNRCCARTTDGTKCLPLELIVRVFRTYKGDIEQGIQGSIQLRNPGQPGHQERAEDIFTAKDDSINTFDIAAQAGRRRPEADRPVQGPGDARTAGWKSSCSVSIGPSTSASPSPIATSGCPMRSPLWNFVKAQVSIWVQMVLVIAIGVTCSTLVNGPVAMMFTVSFITLGFFRAVLRRRGDRQAGRRRAGRVARTGS